jgi:hypothetical protein
VCCLFEKYYRTEELRILLLLQRSSASQDHVLPPINEHFPLQQISKETFSQLMHPHALDFSPSKFIVKSLHWIDTLFSLAGDSESL